MNEQEMRELIKRHFRAYLIDAGTDWHNTKEDWDKWWKYIYARVPQIEEPVEAYKNRTHTSGGKGFSKTEDMTEMEQLGHRLKSIVSGMVGGRIVHQKGKTNHRKMDEQLKNMGPQKSARYRKLADELDFIPSDKAISISFSGSMTDIRSLRQQLEEKGYRFEFIELPGKVHNGSWKVLERPMNYEQLGKDLSKELSSDPDLAAMLKEWLADKKRKRAEEA